MMSEAVLTALVTAAIAFSAPLLLAAIGEAISERGGMLNLGIEGVMLASGFGAFVVSVRSGSPMLGVAAGIGIGLATGLLFGVLVAMGRADQVILGLGMTLAGTGGTAFLFREEFGSTQPLLDSHFSRPFSGALDAIPILGPAIADQRWPIYIAWAIVPVGHWILFRTTFGLRIRAAGELPFGLYATGGDVIQTRVLAATIAGGCSGIAGAVLVIVNLGFFTPGTTAGIGFLAIAVAMLGRLSPRLIALVAIGYGLLAGLDTALQIARVDVRPEFLQMLPYAAAVVALMIWGRHVSLPKALGTPWNRSDGR